jgi:hypothetical protein
METTQGNSLCSYLYLKLAKMPCFSFLSFMFFLLQNLRTGGWNWFWGRAGTSGRLEGRGGRERGRRMNMVKYCLHMHVNEKTIPVETVPGIREMGGDERV